MMNLANKITLARILAVPFLVFLLTFENTFLCLVAAVVFIIASATDMVDGFIARRHNLVTNFGKFLDPLADKLLISSVLIMLAWLEWIPAWVVVLVVCRELTVTGLRAVAMEQGFVLAADRYGKIKTILQVVALVPLIVHYPFLDQDPQPLGMFLLYLAVAMTVFSGGNYLYTFYKMWLDKQNVGV